MKKRFNSVNPMEIALALMDIGYLPNEPGESAEEENREVPKKQECRKPISRKAAISKRRRASILKDRKARANEADNRLMRIYWKFENLGYWGDKAPIKERKLDIRAKYLLGDIDPVTDVE